MSKNAAAVQLGRLGGQARTDAKAEAARENGKKGGRPPKPAKAGEKKRRRRRTKT